MFMVCVSDRKCLGICTSDKKLISFCDFVITFLILCTETSLFLRILLELNYHLWGTFKVPQGVLKVPSRCLAMKVTSVGLFMN